MLLLLLLLLLLSLIKLCLLDHNESFNFYLDRIQITENLHRILAGLGPIQMVIHGMHSKVHNQP